MTPADETLAEVAKHVAVLRRCRIASYLVGHRDVRQAIDVLIDLVPEPEPEWPDEVVDIFVTACGCTPGSKAREYLTAMHKAGLRITMEETP